MEDLTIYDIAKRAGVSPATVSRVINNYPHVKKATRMKVQKVLSENHFIPNETARNLAMQSSRTVVVMVADLRTQQYTDGVYYIEQEFSRLGYSCLVYNTGTDAEKQANFIRFLSTRNISSVVLMGSTFQNDRVKEAIQTYLTSTPIAICNGYIDMKNVYGVVADEKGGVYSCVKMLASKGKRKIAFLYDDKAASNEAKIEGYTEAIKSTFEYEPIIYSAPSKLVKDISETTRRLLTEYPNVDGIIFSDDFMALGSLHVLEKLHKRIPADIAIVGINNSQFAEVCIPALTSLDNKLYDLSVASVRNILEVLNGEHALKKIIICSEIVEREST